MKHSFAPGSLLAARRTLFIYEDAAGSPLKELSEGDIVVFLGFLERPEMGKFEWRFLHKGVAYFTLSAAALTHYFRKMSEE